MRECLGRGLGEVPIIVGGFGLGVDLRFRMQINSNGCAYEWGDLFIPLQIQHLSVKLVCARLGLAQL